MSEELQKQLATALTRLATLEGEVSRYRARPKEPEAPAFDPHAFAQAMTRNPIGTMQQMGIPVDYVTQVMVANALGDQAPPHLQMLVQQGPQIAATQALDSKVEALSRQLSAITDERTKVSKRESMKTAIANKELYPHLAKAYSANAALIETELDEWEGDASEIAKKIEERLAALAPVFGAASTASAENADDQGQSTQAKPALAGTMSGDPPPLPQASSGVFTKEDHVKLRDEIVRKYSSQ